MPARVTAAEYARRTGGNTTMTAALYNPPDVDKSHAAWKANCGPCALAAILGRPVADVRPFFPRYPKYPWTNPTHMRAALDAAGVRHRSGNTIATTNGLWFVQLDGPWCSPEVPVTVAYRHTHWVAVRMVSDGTDSGESDEWVYDANAREWEPLSWWKAEVIPHVLAHVKRATGWWVRTGIELEG